MENVQHTTEPGRKDGRPVSLLLFDVDCLKAVNQAFGHAIGDQAIQILADRLSRVVRPIDMVGQMGGGEFAALLPECSARTAFAIADQVRAAFQDDAQCLNGQQVGVTISAGIATTAQSASNQPDILAGAQTALNQAKTAGGNRISHVDNGATSSEP